MQGLICSSCGSNSFDVVGDMYVCQYCGTKFPRNKPKIASFDNGDRIDNLLKRADLYWKRGKRAQAIALYRQVLELDASCEIAKQRTRWR